MKADQAILFNEGIIQLINAMHNKLLAVPVKVVFLCDSDIKTIKKHPQNKFDLANQIFVSIAESVFVVPILFTF